LLVVLAVAVHQWKFWHEDRLIADIMTLLPIDEQRPEIALATSQLTRVTSNEIVVMLGAQSWDQVQQAVGTWRAALDAARAPLSETAAVSNVSAMQMLAFYKPWRDRLLTVEQRNTLSSASPPTLLQTALAALYQPALQTRLSEWNVDPLGLWPQWWAARIGEGTARPRDGLLWASAAGKDWAVLRYQIAGSAFSLDGSATYADALRSGIAAVHAGLPDIQILRAGVPLHAEAAAVQASREMNIIGWGSLAAVLLLVWLTFRALNPMLMIGMSLVIGCAVALSVTALVFGKVHLITLIFGASLVGVAEDYGIHYFASRQGQPDVPARTLMRQLLPALLLALATSVLAYLALGLASFPGLRQMALFSAVGLVAAMLTVVCWFPLADFGTLHPTAFSRRISASLARWPRLRATRSWSPGYVLVALFCFAGILQLQSTDDVRQLQNSPSELLEQQVHLGKLLGLPSPAQFYLVQGNSVEEVLLREEALKAHLDGLVEQDRLTGYSALSDWVPSAARQKTDAALTAEVESTVLAGINRTLGEKLERPAFAGGNLALDVFLQDPVSAPVRGLWLGNIGKGEQASIVMLRGLSDLAVLPSLQTIALDLDGVSWVDRPAEISSMMQRYRHTMTLLLILGHAAVLCLLLWRYRSLAWRAWLPTALATLLTLTMFGFLGHALQLFNVLALLLLLGVGVDYGIFLLEHRNDGAAWLAVLLGAVSTWLAFGLLALSTTPALGAFGLTLMIGLALVGLLAPLLRAGPEPRVASTIPDSQ